MAQKALLALFGLGWVNYYQRTQSVEVAAAVAERAQPGDVVVYCPDQLGPAFSREMPDGLDEISYPMSWGWIDPREVAAVLLQRPKHVSVFLTGRDMAQAVIDVADTVTEMVAVKHPFEQGIRARRGIDY